jgi:hypothetical protein
MATGVVRIDGKKLDAIRHRMFLSQRDFCVGIKMRDPRYREIVGADASNVFYESFVNIATFLKKSPDELLAEIGAAEPGGSAEEVAMLAEMGINAKRLPRMVPVRWTKQKLACGGWIDTWPQDQEDGVIEIQDHALMHDWGTDDVVGVELIGDSMERSYLDGDKVIFQCVPREAWQVYVTDGTPCYVQHVDDKATFKLVYWDLERELVILRAVNTSKYPEPMEVPINMVARLCRSVLRISTTGRMARRPR